MERFTVKAWHNSCLNFKQSINCIDTSFKSLYVDTICMKKFAAWSIIFLILSMSLAVANVSTNNAPNPQFAIPQLNSQIGFVGNVSYSTAELQNSTWYFTGLQTDGKPGYLPIWGHLHISAQNCNVSINYLQSWSQPEIGSVGLQWIKYSVVGAGFQTLDGNDLFPTSNRWTQWTVIINGNRSQIGESWNYTDKKQLIIHTEKPSNVEINVLHTAENSSTAPLPPPSPAAVNFTSNNYFPIPANKATINFAVDGSYDQAILNYDTWEFTNLTLSTYAINAGTFAPNVTGRNVLPYILQANYPANLGVSAQDCNLTITGIGPLTWHSHDPGINYTVDGIGSQIFTFPFQLVKFNWTITIDGVPKENGDGWYILGDQQVKIVDATQQVEITGILLPSVSPPIITIYPLVILSLVIIGLVVAVGSAAFIVHRKRKSQKQKS